MSEGCDSSRLPECSTTFGCLELFTFRTFGHIVLAASQLDTHRSLAFKSIIIDEVHIQTALGRMHVLCVCENLWSLLGSRCLVNE